MLPLPNLNNQSFEEIVSAAIDKIKDYPNIWNDSDVHDPGVTLLDLLAYLKFTQQNYINTVGSKSLVKLLKLLGITMKKAEPAVAECCFSSENEVLLPPGIKLTAPGEEHEQELVFETEEALTVLANSVTHIIQNNVSVPNGIQIEVFGAIPQNGASFFIVFEQALPQNTDIYMKILLYTKWARNPADRDFVPLSKIRWFYYGEENGLLDWHPVHITKDTTHALLYTGRLKFSLAGRHLQKEKVYMLKCTLVENGYDTIPRIQKVQLNTVMVKQKDTLCHTVHFTKYAVQKDFMLFYTGIVKNPETEVFFKINGGWYSEKSLQISYAIQKNPDAFQLIFSDRKKVLEILQNEQEVFPVRLVIKSPLMRLIDKIPGSNGISNQTFLMNAPGYILYDEFQLMVGRLDKNGVLYFEDWYKAEDFNNAAPDEPVYILNSQKAAIQFGDNQQGRVPEKAEGNIYIRSFSITKGLEGNVQAGQIGLNERENIYVNQFDSAKGGSRPETYEEAVLRARKNFGSSSRAVTKEDFEEITLNTSGLLLKGASALPLYAPKLIGYPEKKEQNCITVVFDHYSEFENKSCTELYIQRIAANLEKHKLLTTKVYVMPPAAIGLEIYGEVVTKPQFKNQKEMYNAALSEFLEKQQGLGKTIFFGDIFGIIDSLACTEYVRYIRLDAEGEALQKNKMGDIILPPNGRAYLKDNYLVLICI